MYHDNRDLPQQKSIEEVEGHKLVKRTKKTISAFCKYLPPPLKIVDLGARVGIAVELLANAGYDAVGIELINEYVKRAVAKKRNVVWGDIMDLKISDKFDVVYSRNTIEHCRDIDKFLETCKRLLRAAGSLFLVFPIEKNLEYMPALGMTRAGHMTCFKDMEDAKRKIEKAGFNIIHIGWTRDNKWFRKGRSTDEAFVVARKLVK